MMGKLETRSALRQMKQKRNNSTHHIKAAQQVSHNYSQNYSDNNVLLPRDIYNK
jgi:hypothetical protein